MLYLSCQIPKLSLFYFDPTKKKFLSQREKGGRGKDCGHKARDPRVGRIARCGGGGRIASFGRDPMWWALPKSAKQPFRLFHFYADTLAESKLSPVYSHKKSRLQLQPALLILVAAGCFFSNQFLEDLDKIWEMRKWIPDPTKPISPQQYYKHNK